MKKKLTDTELNNLISKHLPETEPVTDEEQNELDEQLGLNLKQVTIRLQEQLIHDLKLSARKKGLKYQTYLRTILTEHINREKTG